ncbi:starch-binding protein [uncultured Eubacterium sp.]|uniref:starch-binding protein n=1 Tax=uncultured Eubacterium sp. TaxID=165185 RepID=UPI0032654899
MSKVIKRVATFCFMAVLLIAMIPQTIKADETSDAKKAVYVQVPKDWEAPCVWAWDDDGNNAFEAWPGEEMDADTTNEGWYYIWVPAWANHVIVNANEGNVQTAEQVLEGEKDCWITVTDADNANVTYDKQTKGKTPEYVVKFAIHAKVDDSWKNPCLWAWSVPDGTNAFDKWPGMEMKQNDNGWYTAKVPVWVNSIIINANDGSVQTEDISIDAAEVWVTVDADGKAEFSYTDPDKQEVPNITVHVMAPSDWDSPCLWAWSAPDGTNAFGSWPGDALEEGENGWLVKEVPGWVNSLIVNGNEGSVQTSDISVDTGKDVWLVVKDAENFEVSYEEPQVDTTEDVQATEDATEAPEVTEKSDSSNAIPIILMIVVAAVVIVVIVVVIKKKKAKNK